MYFLLYIWFGALMAQAIVNPTFSNDCRSTMSRPWSWEDHSYRHWQSSSQAPPSFTPDLPAHIGKTAMYIVMKIVCMGTHCLKPFSPQLGLENGASMVWIPCKYRWRRCAGTKPRNSPCDHFPQITFLQPILKGFAGTICWHRWHCGTFTPHSKSIRCNSV